MSVCRACLSSNVGMYHIDDTGLHDKFESISNIKYSAGDGRPENVCYICYTLLRKFYDFIATAQRSEKIFKLFIGQGVKITKHTISHLQIRKSNYCWLRLKPISMGGPKTPPVIPIKKEVIVIDKNSYAEYVEMSDILKDFDDPPVKDDPDLLPEEVNLPVKAAPDLATEEVNPPIKADPNLATVEDRPNVKEEPNLATVEDSPNVKEEPNLATVEDSPNVKKEPNLATEENNSKLDDLSTIFEHKLVSILADDDMDIDPKTNQDQDCIILEKVKKPIVIDEFLSDISDDEDFLLMMDEKESQTLTKEKPLSLPRVEKELGVSDISEDEDLPLTIDEYSSSLESQPIIEKRHSKLPQTIPSHRKHMSLDQCGADISEDEDLPLIIDEKCLGLKYQPIIEKKHLKLPKIIPSHEKKHIALDQSEANILEDEDLPLMIDEKCVSLEPKSILKDKYSEASQFILSEAEQALLDELGITIDNEIRNTNEKYPKIVCGLDWDDKSPSKDSRSSITLLKPFDFGIHSKSLNSFGHRENNVESLRTYLDPMTNSNEIGRGSYSYSPKEHEGGGRKTKKHLDFDSDNECEDYSSQRKLTEHNRKKHPEKLYTCRHCISRFDTKINLKKHIKEFHPVIHNKLICDVCRKRYKTHHYLTLHKLHRHSQPVKRFTCNTCGKIYIDRLNFKYHTLFVHPPAGNNLDVS